MPITQYTGKTLLQSDVVANIQKQSDAIVKNKDVALAWAASRHLKEQLERLGQEEIKGVLDSYIRITSKLKALALPLLALVDVEHLLEHNLEFLDTIGEQYLEEGLRAWIASQPDEQVSELKKKLISKIDKESVFAPKILDVLKSNHPQEQKKIVSENDEVGQAGFARPNGIVSDRQREANCSRNDWQ